MCAANCDTICETVFISDVTLVYADGLDQAHKRTNMAGRRSGRIYLNEADIEAQLNPGDEENYIYEDIDELNGNEAGWIDDHDELEAIYDAFGITMDDDKYKPAIIKFYDFSKGFLYQKVFLYHICLLCRRN